MQQMFRYGIMAVFFILCSWCDIKTRKLPAGLILLFAAAGIFVNIFWPMPYRMWIGGFLLGGGILLLGKLTGEQIGYGDGLILIVGAFFLTGKEMAVMFLTALFLCAVFAVFLFLAGRARRRMRLPFVPFLAAAFLLLAAEHFR